MTNNQDYEKIIPSPFERGFDSMCTKLVPFVPKKLKPNHITFIGFLAGLTAGFSFYLATFNKIWFFVAAIGVLIHLFADSLDGAVARERSLVSKSGQFVDIFSDVVTAIAMFIGVGFSSYASINIMLFPAIAYPLHNLVQIYWIYFKQKMPHPVLGPFEMHFFIIVFTIITYFFDQWSFTIWNYSLRIFDIGAIIFIPFSYFEIFKSAFKLYRELERP